MNNIYLSEKEIDFIKHLDLSDEQVIRQLDERKRRCLDNIPLYRFMIMPYNERLEEEAKERIIRNYFTKPFVRFTDLISSITTLETQSVELRLEMIKQATKFQNKLNYWS